MIRGQKKMDLGMGELGKGKYLAFAVALAILILPEGRLWAQTKKPDGARSNGAQAQQKAGIKPTVAGGIAKPEQAKAGSIAPVEDVARLKAQLTALQAEVNTLRLKVATLELEKQGAYLLIDKTKDGKEFATVNIMKTWSGDKAGLALLKTIPNLQAVYVDNNQFNDSAMTVFKELPGLTALTVMSPQVTSAGLASLAGLSQLTVLYLTGSKIDDKGLGQLKSLAQLQVLALSRTGVTDAGLDALRGFKNLKSLYLIGTKVTPAAVDKLKQAMPGLAVYK